MKKVWTDSQGTIQSPSPGSRRSCFSKPVRLGALVFARSAASASTALRVSFRTLTFNFQDYNTSTREELCRQPCTRARWFARGLLRRRPLTLNQPHGPIDTRHHEPLPHARRPLDRHVRVLSVAQTEM